MLESRMSRFGRLLAPAPPLASKRPSPEGSVAELRRIGSPLTVALVLEALEPPFCRTYIPWVARRLPAGPFESRMSRFARLLAPATPLASKRPSPEGSVAELRRIGSPLTVALDP